MVSDQPLTAPAGVLGSDSVTRKVASRISMQPLYLVEVGSITVTRIATGYQYDAISIYTGVHTTPGVQVPAPPPFVGGFIISLPIDDLDSAIPVYRAITIQAGKATTGSGVSKFAGVAVSTGNPGGSILVQMSGPLDPTKFNLGPGVVDAVGINSQGNLVRATDPACVSGQNAVGWCDQTGLVYVYPAVPGPSGLPGPSTVAGVLNASLVARTVLVQDPTIPGRYKTSTTGPFAGLLMESGTSGQSKTITVRGPVDPLFHSLGVGVACAVGVNSSGLPVRVTDPTCVSGLSLLGYCDASGAIVIAPREANAYDPRDFGAWPNDPTSDLAAALRLIIARMPADGGAVHFVHGEWRLLSSEPTLPGVHVLVTKAIQLLGSNGFGPANHNCRIIAQPGLTAFRFVYGYNSLVSRVAIEASGILATTSTVASYTPALIPAVITVSPGHDFEVGQVVRMKGAAQPRKLTSLAASVTAGSATVTIAAPLFPSATGIRAGDWITLGTAYPSATKVLATNLAGTILTMASNAAATVTAGDIYLCPEMYFRIISITGNDITVDNHNSDGTALTGAILEHGDAAIDALSMMRIESVNFGAPLGYGFAGAAILELGDPSFAMVSNTNLTSVSGIYVYACAHAVFAYGVCSHVSEYVGVNCVQTTSWAVLDLSGYGNCYVRMHADGGRGFLSADIANETTLIHAYFEGGTAYYLGTGTISIGGNMSSGSGGVLDKATGRSSISIWSTGSQHREDHDPTRYFGQFLNAAGPGASGYGLQHRMTAAGEGASDAAFQKWHHTGGTDGILSSPGRTAMAIADVGSRWRPGVVWLPRGYVVGTAPNGADNPTYAAVITVGSAPPTAPSDRVKADGTLDGTWQVGDLIINSAPTASGPGAWQCTGAGTYLTSIWKVAWTVSP